MPRALSRTRKTKAKLHDPCAGAAFGLCAMARLRARPPPRLRPFVSSLTVTESVFSNGQQQLVRCQPRRSAIRVKLDTR